MHILVISLLFILGLLLIIKGGDLFVDAASWIAEVSGIPPFIIGATVVSLATTLPELLVSAIAAAQGKVDLAIGNSVGSVTANLGLIMGISLVCLPSVMKRANFAAKGILMLGASLSILLFSLTGRLLLPGILLLVVFFALFLAENIHQAKKAMAVTDLGNRKAPRDRRTVCIQIVKFILGAAGIVIGARLLVDNGSALASILGVPESVIAVTMVSVGTSLPELVTTITAISKKQTGLSIGNILGANIIDLSLILPVSSAVSGSLLTISRQSLLLDFPFCLAVGAIAVVPTLIAQKTRRVQGIALLVVYGVYVTLVCTGIVGA